MDRKKTPKITNDTAHPHTVKKFELIEEYVKAWAQKLLKFDKCHGIVFIDCITRSGSRDRRRLFAAGHANNLRELPDAPSAGFGV